jgi:hypothetical protein
MDELLYKSRGAFRSRAECVQLKILFSDLLSSIKKIENIFCDCKLIINSSNQFVICKSDYICESTEKNVNSWLLNSFLALKDQVEPQVAGLSNPTDYPSPNTMITESLRNIITECRNMSSTCSIPSPSSAKKITQLVQNMCDIPTIGSENQRFKLWEECNRLLVEIQQKPWEEHEFAFDPDAFINDILNASLGDEDDSIF